MYRKRSKAATVSKPISPKKPPKQSISFDSPSLSMSKEKSNSLRRSPSPDDLFEDRFVCIHYFTFHLLKSFNFIGAIS